MQDIGHFRAKLLAARAALRRCEDGSYGDCLDCEEPIDPRRLGLDPAIALCIGCAEKRSYKHRR
ncbi:MAG: TraR/DksA C4-type zinc finger protein [Gammaproteobacteria bacterium SHHR-1]|uniref:TraR/DksA family transcriptional regulator n=1 Tax=Magnetovirga frankeli TaxID=947516 RepID=UPI001293D73E|nr:TraR/DksA C4-type zinc finger protein [gamma proteobacterium SS-5]